MADGPVRMTRCLGSGMVGFGVGGAVTPLLGDAMALGWFLQGALGGGLLGLATRSPRQALGIAGLAAGVSFTGQFLTFLIVLSIWEPTWSTLFMGSVSGAVLGAALGARSAGPIGLPIGGAAGAVGLGAGYVVALGRTGFTGVGFTGVLSAWSAWFGAEMSTSWWFGMMLYGFEGVLAGACLGWAWGYCEQRVEGLGIGATAPPPTPTLPKPIIPRRPGEKDRVAIGFCVLSGLMVLGAFGYYLLLRLSR